MTRRRRMILEDESEDDLPILRQSMQPMQTTVQGEGDQPKENPQLIGAGKLVGKASSRKASPKHTPRKLRKAKLPEAKTALGKKSQTSKATTSAMGSPMRKDPVIPGTSQ
ncbi:unnamed protein product [Linum trigynum]